MARAIVIQTVRLSVSEMKSAALDCGVCISSYKTEAHGWTARVSFPISEHAESGERSYDIDIFAKMTFGSSEVLAVTKAYIWTLEHFASMYFADKYLPKAPR